jgi:hypothetical protein
MAHGKSCLTRFWIWVKSQIVQEVPKDIAHCAFDCNKEACTGADWDHCRKSLEDSKNEQLRRVK